MINFSGIGVKRDHFLLFCFEEILDIWRYIKRHLPGQNLCFIVMTRDVMTRDIVLYPSLSTTKQMIKKTERTN